MNLFHISMLRLVPLFARCRFPCPPCLGLISSFLASSPTSSTDRSSSSIITLCKRQAAFVIFSQLETLTSISVASTLHFARRIPKAHSMQRRTKVYNEKFFASFKSWRGNGRMRYEVRGYVSFPSIT